MVLIHEVEKPLYAIFEMKTKGYKKNENIYIFFTIINYLLANSPRHMIT